MATFGSAEDLGLLADAGEWEATEAKRQVVLGDGAGWIKTQASEHFPDAVKMLEGPHLWRQIRNAVRTLQPGKQRARRTWRKEQDEVHLPSLWEGKRWLIC